MRTPTSFHGYIDQLDHLVHPLSAEDPLVSIKMSTEVLPPAQPAFILRGHSAQIHALHFTPGNSRLLTADADGWVVSWNLSFRRPVAVWKPHSNAVLALGSWGPERILT